jgi:ADP-ribose pyrophosphatase YjhB (NUDIX family)
VLTPSPRRIRVSAKLVVVADHRLLVTCNRSEHDPDGEWLLLPGGGQRPGETLLEALRREVAEETGLAVEPGSLLWIREYRSDQHEFADIEPGKHHIEFMFSGRVAAGGPPHAADDHQVGWGWVDLDDLASRCFYPAALLGPLQRWAEGGDPGPVYLGDVN